MSETGVLEVLFSHEFEGQGIWYLTRATPPYLVANVKVAIKSMKKSFDSFSECLRLREVQVRL